VGEMATALAHELNQPLTALSTYADAIRLLARNHGAEQLPLVQTADSIRRVATRCADIVARFRAAAPGRAGGSRPVRLEETLRAAIDAVGERAERIGATIDFDCHEPLPELTLDPDRICLAFRNVLANALDAARERTDRPPRVAIEVRREGREHVVVTVRDSGRGVPLDMIERIFEPFYSGKAQGMGLGLAVSRSIVESHGGRLWAEPGDTGVFHFRLPA
jgi:two-component system sensor kinase FixL